MLGVHFKPGGAARLLGVPPGNLANDHVGLDDLWGPAAIELRERLCAAPSLQERFELLEQALIARLPDRPDGRPAVRAGLAELDHPGVEIGHVAGALGLSRRRFIEVFTEDVGMAPKRYSMVRRFQGALALAIRSQSATWSQVALECGYFDQSHLCRDWVEFTGMSPVEFFALRAIPVKENHVAVPAGGSNPSKTRPGRPSRLRWMEDTNASIESKTSCGQPGPWSARWLHTPRRTNDDAPKK